MHDEAWMLTFYKIRHACISYYRFKLEYWDSCAPHKIATYYACIAPKWLADNEMSRATWV